MTTANLSSTILVTGANDGLGIASVSKLLPSQEPFNSIYTIRSYSESSSRKRKSLVPKSSNVQFIIPLDLTSLSWIRSFANDLNTQI